MSFCVLATEKNRWPSVQDCMIQFTWNRLTQIAADFSDDSLAGSKPEVDEQYRLLPAAFLAYGHFSCLINSLIFSNFVNSASKAHHYWWCLETKQLVLKFFSLRFWKNIYIYMDDRKIMSLINETKRNVSPRIYAIIMWNY